MLSRTRRPCTRPLRSRLTAAVDVETVEHCTDEQTEPMGVNGLVVVEPVPASGLDPTG
jgi:hypothetical protein